MVRDGVPPPSISRLMIDVKHPLTIPTSKVASDAILVAIVVLLGIVGIALQWNTHLNHDIAWILYSAGKMIDGAQFGRDIIAANPPLAWYLAIPSLAAADRLALPPADAYRIFVILVDAACLGFIWVNRRRAVDPSARLEYGMLALALAYVLFPGSYRDFGQREYLCLALTLPYLLAASTRLNGGSVAIAAALVIGAAAGIGFALKPYFLAVPLFVEMAAAYRSRRLFFPVRPETIAIAAVIVAYVAVVLISAPAYVSEVLPLVRAIYWGFDNSIINIIANSQVAIFGIAAVIYLYVVGGRTALQTVLLAAILGFFVSYVAQMKGYTYHAYPFAALVIASLVMHAAAFARGLMTDRNLAPRAALAMGAALLVVGSNAAIVREWYQGANMATGRLGREIGDMIDLVDRHAGGGTFLALSTHPFPGFSTAIYSRAEWGGRTNSQLILPSIVKMRDAGVSESDPRLRFAEATARTMLREDIERSMPALILVDVGKLRHAIGVIEFDFLEFYWQDPELRRIWRSYEELAPTHGYRVFVRAAAEQAS